MSSVGCAGVAWAACVVVALTCTYCGPSEVPPQPPPTETTIRTVAGTGLAAFTGDGRPAVDSPLYAPVKVTFTREGRPWIIDWNNHRVREIQPDGSLLTVVGTGFEAPGQPNVLSIAFSIHHPLDVERTASGELVFAGYHDPRVFKVDGSSRIRAVAGLGAIGNSGDERPAFEAAMNTPSGIAVARDGTVYFAEQGNHQIRRVGADEVVHRVAGTGEPGYGGDGGSAAHAPLNGPTRLELDGAGRLYLCDTNNHVIRRIDTDGRIETIAGTGEAGYTGDGGPAREARLSSPLDLVLRPDGTLLVADTGNHVIRRITPAGTIHTIVGTSSAGFSGDGGPPLGAQLDGPWGLSIDEVGTLWIADTHNNRVRVVSPMPLAGW